jgi:hypothetical protein
MPHEGANEEPNEFGRDFALEHLAVRRILEPKRREVLKKLPLPPQLNCN